MLGDGSLVSTGAKGKTIIVMSTLAPELMKGLGKKLKRKVI
jgi:hypothetical protein